MHNVSKKANVFLVPNNNNNVHSWKEKITPNQRKITKLKKCELAKVRQLGAIIKSFKGNKCKIQDNRLFPKSIKSLKQQFARVFSVKNSISINPKVSRKVENTKFLIFHQSNAENTPNEHNIVSTQKFP